MASGKVKKNLSRQRIVDTGLVLAESENIDGVSIHKIAKSIGVTPMAIYRHFANKADLQAEMLDQFIANSHVIPPQGLTWQQWLDFLARKMFDALKQQPSWVPIFGQIRLKPGALEVKQACIEKLIDAGFSQHQAIQAFFGIIQCVIGAANQHVQIAQSDNDPNSTFASIKEFDLLNCSLSYFIKGLNADLNSSEQR